MVETSHARPVHVFIFEPRVEGHHLGFLKVIAEELAGAGYRLTLAIDTAAGPYARIRAAMPEVLQHASILSATDGGKRGATVGHVAALFKQSQADLAFLPNLDEIGSAMLRRAAFGLMPPALLRGRLGGIYHRPRFLGALGVSPNQHLKAAGFARLLRSGYFSHLLLLDPYLQRGLKSRKPDAPAFFLSDFFPTDFAVDRAAARRQLSLPENRRIFLFYGAGYRRKGLALAVQAMLAMPDELPAFLLCAGKQPADSEIARGLETLVARGRARVVNRYITDDEEKEYFAASDIVLLPYLRHFGISGVLMRAIGAGLPVIVSEDGLIGRLARERNLGIPFRSGDASALGRAIERAARASPEEMARWQASVRADAPNWTRAAFRDAMLGSFDTAVMQLNAQTL